MSYVDGFVIAVPTKNLELYKKDARFGKKIWMKHGALQYFECVADDVAGDPGFKMVPFPKLVKAKPDETIIFSFIIYKNKKHRDAVNKKVMSSPEMNDPKQANREMPFKMNRFSYGGFDVIVEG